MGRGMWRRQTAPRNLQFSCSSIRSWAACVPRGNPCHPRLWVAAEVPQPCSVLVWMWAGGARSRRLRSPWHHGTASALQRRRFDGDLIVLQQLCRDRRIQGLVVGLPLDAAGQPTAQAEHCRRYGRRLAQALQLPLARERAQQHLGGGEQYGLSGDRSVGLTARCRVAAEQWLREGPELKLASHWGQRGHEQADGGS